MALYNTTTKDEFEKLITSGRPVLVDFWAAWCPPCRMMAPVLEGIAQKVDEADIVKIDIEATQDNARLAGEHGVQSIPNLKLFKDGKIVEEFIGVTPSNILIEALKKA